MIISGSFLLFPDFVQLQIIQILCDIKMTFKYDFISFLIFPPTECKGLREV